MSKTTKDNQPKICPLSGRSSFASHAKECPHGENYVKKCKEFSSWFWHKVAQFETEPITEEKIPGEIIQKIYGRGKNDVQIVEDKFFDLLCQSLDFVLSDIGLNKEKFIDEICKHISQLTDEILPDSTIMKMNSLARSIQDKKGEIETFINGLKQHD